ncbi:hypothetical protein PFLA_a4110 [Pseudoalteromonas flavipulchra NCIMB 2033 = ATCC BAA-314]|nr:hypothetical protein [Pseudoalteromonas flavipulchra NCIMB 2033 = ATCC BAA-314]
MLRQYFIYKCCGSINPDTILGGIITTQLEVSNGKKTSNI